MPRRIKEPIQRLLGRHRFTSDNTKRQPGLREKNVQEELL
jgi:hypothetical protein